MTRQIKGEDIQFDILPYTKDYENAVRLFDCGNEVLNNYLFEKAANDFNAVTYLVVNRDNGEVIGFISLACSGIQYIADDECLRVTLPAIEIKYFAILNTLHKLVYDDMDEHFYFSDMVLCEVLKKCRYISDEIVGAKYIILYSVEDAVHFYERNLFKTYTEFMSQDKIRYLNGCIPMYMEL